MAETITDEFWEKDLVDLPGTIQIDEKTSFVSSLGGIPIDIRKQSNEILDLDNK